MAWRMNTISVARLSEWTDPTFDLFDSYEDAATLAAAARHGGYAPVLVDSERGRMVTGFGWIRAARGGVVDPALEVRALPAPADLGLQICAATAAVVQWRALSAVEELRVVETAEQFGVVPQVGNADGLGVRGESDAANAPSSAAEPGTAGLLGSLLGGRDRIALIQRKRALGEPWTRAVAADAVDLKTAERALHLDRQAAAALLAAIAPLSASRRRIACTMFEEIVRRDGLNPEEQLALAAADSLVETLSARRYPQLNAMRGTVERFHARRLKGSGVRIDLPDAFEGERITVSFDFVTIEQYRRRLNTLSTLEDDLHELLGLLF